MSPKPLLRIVVTLQRSLGRMLRHDCLNLAQSAAYSAMVALFPALIVAAAAMALLPDVNTLKVEAGEFFNEVLPATVYPMLNAYFGTSNADAQPHTTQALVLAAIVSITAGSSALATVMEGLHRAAGVTEATWTFWQKRLRALALVPLSLAPLTVASVLVVFGRLIEEWVGHTVLESVRPAFFAVALALRWVVSLAGVAGVTALIYHLGVPSRSSDGQQRRWMRVLPGAVMATALWFVSTLVFGWYVTRIANYSAVYGSLGVGIALLFWLNLVFLSVLCGAEFNEQLAAQQT